MQLNYKSFGSGPGLIILHGLFGALDNWQSLAKRYAEHFSVFIIDQRNHGRSPQTTDPFTYPSLADDLFEFMTQQGIYSSHIIGHSMGGKVAMQFAVDHEGMVDRLVVADMAPRKYKPHHEEVLDALSNFPFDTITRRQDAEEWLATRIHDWGTLQFILKNLHREGAGAFEWKFNYPILLRDYDHILEGIQVQFPVNVATLFLRGGNSNYVRDENFDDIRRDFLEAQFDTIQDAGHWLHADKPDVFFEKTMAFLLGK